MISALVWGAGVWLATCMTVVVCGLEAIRHINESDPASLDSTHGAGATTNHRHESGEDA